MTSKHKVIVPARVSTHVVELLLADMPIRAQTIEIHLPRDLAFDSVMVKPRVLQLIITARSRTDDLTVVFKTPSAMPGTLLDDWLKKDHILLSFLLAKRILGHGKTAIERESYGPSVAKRLLALYQQSNPDNKPMRRANVRALAVDFTNRPKLAAPPLFYREYALRGKPSFHEGLNRIWEAMTWPGAPGQAIQMATIIYELFENAHLYAKTFEDDSANPYSLRGVILDFQLLEHVNLELEPDSPLKSFLHRSKSSGATHLLTLSIYDAGIGISSHRRKQMDGDINLTDFDLIRKSFQGSDGSHYNRSKGLPTVAAILSKLQFPGIALIRSGKCHGFIDGASTMDLEPFENSLDYPNVTGTLFTIALPYKKVEL